MQKNQEKIEKTLFFVLKDSLNTKNRGYSKCTPFDNCISVELMIPEFEGIVREGG